jgi:hypothetical protein
MLLSFRERNWSFMVLGGAKAPASVLDTALSVVELRVDSE